MMLQERDTDSPSLNYGTSMDGVRGIPAVPLASQQALLNAQQQFGNLQMPSDCRQLPFAIVMTF